MEENLKEIIFGLRDELKIFYLLTDEELEKVVPYMELLHCSSGTILFKEGDPGDFIGFVISGRLEVKKQTEFKGKQIVLALLSKGSFVGELSIMDDQPRSAMVQAFEDSELFMLRRESLDSLVHDHPFIGVKVLKGIGRIISIRLRKAVERLTVIF